MSTAQLIETPKKSKSNQQVGSRGSEAIHFKSPLSTRCSKGVCNSLDHKIGRPPATESLYTALYLPFVTREKKTEAIFLDADAHECSDGVSGLIHTRNKHI